MLWVWAAFVVLPIAEISMIVKLGSIWGLWPTIAAIFFTALIGTLIVRHQGVAVLLDLQRSISEGRIPAREILEGLSLIFAAAFLITPGFLTDIIGFFIVVPLFRNLTLSYIVKHLYTRFQRGPINPTNYNTANIDGKIVHRKDQNDPT